MWNLKFKKVSNEEFKKKLRVSIIFIHIRINSKQITFYNCLTNVLKFIKLIVVKYVQFISSFWLLQK